MLQEGCSDFITVVPALKITAPGHLLNKFLRLGDPVLQDIRLEH
jgi:hypothetical protein